MINKALDNSMMTCQRSYAERLSIAYTRLWSPTWLHMRPLISSLRYASAFATGLLLDVGCGNKPYFSFFEPHIQAYIGLDLPPETGTRPDVVGVGHALPFSNASFDTVLSTQVLEHTPNPNRMVGEISRVLKPGGHFILTAPQAWRLHEVPHDFYRFTRFGLEYLLTTHGLDIILIMPLGGSFALAGQVLLNTFYISIGKIIAALKRRLHGDKMPLTPAAVTVPWQERLGHLAKHYIFVSLTAPINLLFNLFFGLLDAIFCDEDDTLNYLVIARKLK